MKSKDVNMLLDVVKVDIAHYLDIMIVKQARMTAEDKEKIVDIIDRMKKAIEVS